jgi:prepilin-type N-terminal cleavage/methylation domain-containing protein
MRPLKWLLRNQLKLSRAKQKIYGFTLIELLVAMIIAVIIITPLLGFMIHILDSDRKEQAKATTEQELKTTLDYIARDLQQAVYIYDADGISSIRSQLPNYSQKSQYFPVLVFWKRRFISGGLVVGSGSDDTFVYSLVAYYLINDGSSTWSNAARIGRFELSNGYGQDITDTQDPNFQLFNLSNTGTLRTKMNNWTNAANTTTSTNPNKTYSSAPLAVVDYIDQTPINATTNPKPSCPSVTDPDSTATPPTNLHNQVPDFSSSAGVGDATPTGSVNTQGFYVCVDSTKTVAQIYLRGNALARLQNTNLSFSNTNSSMQTYFPTVSTQVQGIGFLFTK